MQMLHIFYQIHIEGKSLEKKVLAEVLQFAKFSSSKIFHCTLTTNAIYPAVTYQLLSCVKLTGIRGFILFVSDGCPVTLP